MTRAASGAVAVVAWLAAAGAASAQQNVPEQVPPGTIVLGPVAITPAFAMKDVGVDDNVFNEPVDPKSDFTFTANPRATVGFRVRRLHLSTTAGTEYVYYQTYASERGTNVAAEVRADLDLGRLRPYASVAGTNTRSRLNTEVDERARHHDLADTVGLSLDVASRTSVLFSLRRSRINYEPDSSFRGVSLEQSFDGRTDRMEGGFAVALTPVTTFSVIGQRDQQRFELSPARDSDSWRVAPTLTFSPTGLLTGTAAFGYRRFDALNPALPDYSGFVASVAIGATIYGRHQLQGAYTRDVQYSYDPSTPYYLANGGTVTWTTVVAGPFDVRGTAGRNVMQYRGAAALAGADTARVWGGGIGYRFGDHARLGVNLEWVRRESERSADREFRNRRVLASLTWGTS